MKRLMTTGVLVTALAVALVGCGSDTNEGVTAGGGVEGVAGSGGTGGTTGSGTTAGTTTGTTTPEVQEIADVSASVQRAGNIRRPMRFAFTDDRILFTANYGGGVGNAQIGYFDRSTLFDNTAATPNYFTFNTSTGGTSTPPTNLIDIFRLSATNFVATEGFGQSGLNGGSIFLMGLTASGLNQRRLAVTIPGIEPVVDPLFVLGVNGIGDLNTNKTYFFFTEYRGDNKGSVRSVYIDDSNQPIFQTHLSGLNFPAGIAISGVTNDKTMLVCDSGNNRVLSFPVDGIGLTPASNLVKEITVAPISDTENEALINQPFEIVYSGGYYWFGEGMGFNPETGVGLPPKDTGRIRVVKRGELESKIVVDEVGPVAGLNLAQGPDSTALVGFNEYHKSNGKSWIYQLALGADGAFSTVVKRTMQNGQLKAPFDMQITPGGGYPAYILGEGDPVGSGGGNGTLTTVGTPTP